MLCNEYHPHIGYEDGALCTSARRVRNSSREAESTRTGDHEVNVGHHKRLTVAEHTFWFGYRSLAQKTAYPNAGKGLSHSGTEQERGSRRAQ